MEMITRLLLISALGAGGILGLLAWGLWFEFTARERACILTRRGERFCPLADFPGEIQIIDIASALSHVCRFAGHSRRFYSVAEHSVRVSEWIQQQGGDRADQLWGLLHDASEAYLGDVTSPIKKTYVFRLYRRAEARLMYWITQSYGLPAKMPDIVKEADQAIFEIEAWSLHNPPEWWPVPRREPDHSMGWSPMGARQAFLERFNLLTTWGAK